MNKKLFDYVRIKNLILDMLSKGDGTRTIKHSDRWEVYKRDNFECVACGEKENLSIDHIIPVIKGGVNNKINYMTLCNSCNSVKSDKDIEFLLIAKMDINLKNKFYKKIIAKWIK